MSQSGRYWVKLYLEMLDDPKVAMLRDALWRRWVELLLVAGVWGKGGKLPPLDMMAWRLRMTPEQLESELVELARPGLVANVNGGWTIPKFSDRQSALTNAERSQMWRKAERERQTLEGATDVNDSATNRSPDKREIEVEERENPPNDSATNRSAGPPPSPPSAVFVYRQEAGKYPKKAVQDEIANIVGKHRDDVELWRRIVHEWVAMGWNPANVRGMLDFFTRKEIPGRKGEKAPPPMPDFIPPNMRAE